MPIFTRLLFDGSGEIIKCFVRAGNAETLSTLERLSEILRENEKEIEIL